MPAQTDPVTDLGVHPASRTLRAALRANATFAAACGLLLLGLGRPLAGAWRLGAAWLLPAVGAGLVGFAILVAWVAVQPEPARIRGSGRPAALNRLAWVVAADAGWLIASAALVVTVPLPGSALAALLAVGAVVAAITGWQVQGWRRDDPGDPLAGWETVETNRAMPVAPERVWPLLTDHELYGRLAPNPCTCAGGRAWEESCTLWQPGHRFAVDVDTSRYPYPLTVMRGLWQVDPWDGGSAVTMRFAYRVAPTVAGGLFALVFRPLLPPILGRILNGWRRESTDGR
jgi:Polyketide cyclase / dehydrase and lipid transport